MAAPISPSSAASRPIGRQPSFAITQVGLIYFLITLTMALGAMNSQANLLFALWGLMMGLGMVAFVIGPRMLRRLEVERDMPETAIVGHSTAVAYHFHNAKRFWPSLSVSLAELGAAEVFTRQPRAFLMHAPPGRRATASIELIPKRRGLHELGRYQIATGFPFGFLRRTADRRHVEQILVFPAIGEVDRQLLARCRSAETSGASMRPREGGGDEFYGVREYRPGDSPRSIYWRRSARTGTLVARQMTQVAPPRLVVLVDTHNPDQTPQRYAAVEMAIAQGASLASQAMESGLSVGLAVWGGDRWVCIRPNRGKRHRQDLLAALARVPLNARHDASALVDAARPMVRPGTTPVVLTSYPVPGGWSESAHSGVLTIESTSEQARRWFRFAETVDFTRCMPLYSSPALPASTEPQART